MIKQIKQEILTYIQTLEALPDEKFENYIVNIIRRDYASKKLRCKEQVRPIWAGLKVIGKCNFNCEHCWAVLSNQERSFNEIITAINKMVKMGILHITISGGEPFLRKDIFDILKYIKEKNMHLSIYTNGSLLDWSSIQRLENILDDFDVIQVSLDGSDSKTFYTQRKSYMFDKVVQNLEMLGSSRILTRVNMVATKYNLNQIQEVYTLCENMKINTFSVSYVYNLNKGDFLYNANEINDFLLQVKACIYLANSYQTKFKPFIPTQIYEEVENTRKDSTEKIFWDYYSFLYRFTNANGDMYPEVSLELEELKIGNIYDDSVEQLLENSYEIGNKLKVRDLTHTKCEKCSWLNECRGGDLARTYKAFGSINQADPFCHKQIGDYAL